ncbi:beta-glucosidase 24-like [Cornus florida]|uniref:beta-glucosidase 24-like n=1 Tax=Cornus florida TaxID=4283 RepID=UPI00289C3DAE|nr:beta-glucosidase 24-like [Cornus florida]
MGLPQEKKNDPMAPYIATHNIILAHAAATKAYREKYKATQGGEIGLSLVCKWFEPHTMDPMDHDAAKTAADFVVGWYMDPLCYGDYPAAMKEWVHGLPEFSEEEKKLVKGAYDFIGVNYYTSRYARPVKQCTIDLEKGHTKLEYIEEKVDRDGKHIGLLADGSDKIYIYPEGLRDLLIYLKKQYKDPKLYITENGVPSKPSITVSVKEAEAAGKKEEMDKVLNDEYRIDHIRNHLRAVHEAIRKGANVNGYFVWTLMDNMEVGEGYEVRFGLNYVDYLDNHERYPKKSAKWFYSFLKPLAKFSGTEM